VFHRRDDFIASFIEADQFNIVPRSDVDEQGTAKMHECPRTCEGTSKALTTKSTAGVLSVQQSKPRLTAATRNGVRCSSMRAKDRVAKLGLEVSSVACLPDLSLGNVAKALESVGLCRAFCCVRYGRWRSCVLNACFAFGLVRPRFAVSSKRLSLVCFANAWRWPITGYSMVVGLIFANGLDSRCTGE